MDYDSHKVFACIRAANNNSKDKRMNNSTIWSIVSQVEEKLENIKAPSVETIQDTIESLLMQSNWQHTARSYIIYRSEHAKRRDNHEQLMTLINEITFSSSEDSDYKRSNANVSGDRPMGAMLQYGCAVSNFFTDNYIMPKKYVDAHRSGLIHIHDKDFLSIAQNCLQVDLQRVF